VSGGLARKEAARWAAFDLIVTSEIVGKTIVFSLDLIDAITHATS
jgi:hypothetical protein